MDGSTGGVTVLPPAPGVIPRRASDDAELLRLWLHGRGPATLAPYHASARAFLAHAGKPLRAVTLANLQAFADGLAHIAPANWACKLGAIKSLFTFAHRLGYVPFNVAAAVQLPAVRSVRAERIMTEADVYRLLASEPDPRNWALLHLFYGARLRVSEAAGLRWRDVQPRDDAGQVTVFGKGGRTRAVLLPASVWRLLTGLRSDAGPEAVVFRSRSGGGALNASQVHRVVKAAALWAGLPPEVSAHWLRHAHASHALDRGAPIHLVQSTLGHASVATTGRYLHARPGDSSSRFLGL